jgi:nicotinate-nucleotide pyrophosphorylase
VLKGSNIFFRRVVNYISFLQASGNVTIDTVKKIGATGVTYISRYYFFFRVLTDLNLYLMGQSLSGV